MKKNFIKLLAKDFFYLFILSIIAAVLFSFFGRLFIHPDEIKLCTSQEFSPIFTGCEKVKNLDKLVCIEAKYKGENILGTSYKIVCKNIELAIPKKYVKFISYKIQSSD